MKIEQAKRLREPFPPEAIGKLPKPYRADSPKGNCSECNGYHGLPAVHLEYVGHAATTDRLLSVDPEWSWEPFALDESGLPALDRRGNLWIRLTVAGVTRVGVGDGKNAKEIIGDAIRNAAMRFGVALDLWAKEDLHAISLGKSDPPPLLDAPPDESGDSATTATQKISRKASSRQLQAMGAAFSSRGITDRAERLAAVIEIVGREVQSAKDLTMAEAGTVLDELQASVAPGVDASPVPPAPQDTTSDDEEDES